MKKQPTTDQRRPLLREPLTVLWQDGRQETVIIHRLSNTDMLSWLDTGFSKPYLVFRSIDRANPTDRPDQSWFDSLTQDSAFEVVEKALALNNSPEIQKKILAPAAAMLRSWLQMLPSGSPAAATTSPG